MFPFNKKYQVLLMAAACKTAFGSESSPLKDFVVTATRGATSRHRRLSVQHTE